MRVPSGETAGKPGPRPVWTRRTLPRAQRRRSRSRSLRGAAPTTARRPSLVSATPPPRPLPRRDLARDAAGLGVEADQARAGARAAWRRRRWARSAAKAAPVAPASFTRRDRRKRTRSTTPTRLASSTTTARVASEEIASAAPLAFAPSAIDALTVIVGASMTSIAPRRAAYRRWPSAEAASAVTPPPDVGAGHDRAGGEVDGDHAPPGRDVAARPVGRDGGGARAPAHAACGRRPCWS